jgi:arylsulfatase A-like enzyme
MNRRKFLSSATLLGLGGTMASMPLSGIHQNNRRPPNVLVILTDDQGVGDVGWMGNPYLRTPAMDRLAREGTSFTQFNVSPTCSPTRAALLTGRHEFSCGITHTVLARNFLRQDIPTMADSFRAAG